MQGMLLYAKTAPPTVLWDIGARVSTPGARKDICHACGIRNSLLRPWPATAAQKNSAAGPLDLLVLDRELGS